MHLARFDGPPFVTYKVRLGSVLMAALRRILKLDLIT